MKRYAQVLVGCAAVLALTGCGGDKEKIYKQAGQDLEQANYEYALEGFQNSIANEVHIPQSYRGAGIANLELGNYAEAITCFDCALQEKKLSNASRVDILQYRITAYYRSGDYSNAMADCQTLLEYDMDAKGYYLTGRTALAMDAYDEAAANFTKAYEADSTYEMAIDIYQAYIEKGMAADGTGYLERALGNPASSGEDYCNRGRIYFYMEDYADAQREFSEAINKKNREAVLLLGKTYLAQGDTANARAMYQQYNAEEASAKGYNGLALCDLAEGNYDGALTNIAAGLENAETEDMRDLLFNQVVAYERKRDFASAYEKIQAYLQMFPDDREAQKEGTFLAGRVQSAQAQGVPEEDNQGGEGTEAVGDAAAEEQWTDDSQYTGTEDWGYTDQSYDGSYYDGGYYDSGYYGESYYGEGIY